MMLPCETAQSRLERDALDRLLDIAGRPTKWKTSDLHFDRDIRGAACHFGMHLPGDECALADPAPTGAGTCYGTLLLIRNGRMAAERRLNYVVV